MSRLKVWIANITLTILPSISLLDATLCVLALVYLIVTGCA